MPRRALLVTGGLATGKTAVIAELVAIAGERGVAAAAIDLDWLGWATGADSSPSDLIARHLAVLADSYAAQHVERLALARAVVGRDNIAALQAALRGWAVQVVRLVTPVESAKQRLAARDSGAELAAHLEQLAGFDAQVAAAADGFPSVENSNRPLREVALDVWRLGTWDE